MRVAMTRDVSPSIINCLLTYQTPDPIDVDLAREQHRQYEALLGQLGCRVERLPPEPDMPDAVFVEDIAVVLDEVAIIMFPGAAARRLEIPSVEEKLSGYRRCLRIEPPATMDGGDVLTVGRRVFVGRSSRTNEEGILQLRGLLKPYGYAVEGVEIGDCLHLKSAATQVGEEALLIDPARVNGAAFAGFQLIETDPEERHAANALRIVERVIYSTAYPRTRRRLERAGIRLATVDMSELAKAEGGLTCCSLIFSP